MGVKLGCNCDSKCRAASTSQNNPSKVKYITIMSTKHTVFCLRLINCDQICTNV